MDASNDRVIVITGFGLFGNYKLNPSWEAVKQIEIPGVKLVKKQIDVVYDVVDKIVPELWEQYKPKLMIHVGVSCLARGMVLETCANSQGYTKPDAQKCFAKCDASKLSNGCKECLTTDIDAKSLCSHLNQLNQEGKLKLNTIISCNAGRYLCEYIYYTSLKYSQQHNYHCSKTLFIHVPEINEKLNFTVDNIRDQLEAVLEYLSKEI